ncbi:MAG: 50S ribosomal protein L21 [Candidatus Cloacimonadota bacterium]|nr:MAG: 50S ribosomal protein L21 [Candidatus Cloacimonadota bacterium]
MYAIVNFKGVQYKVQPNDVIKVPFIKDKEVENEVILDNVLLINDDKETEIGTPNLSDAKVIAELIEHKKDKKIIVFKKKRRKAYSKKQGHRQKFSKIRIKEIISTNV